jgi:hypothetical protein
VNGNVKLALQVGGAALAGALGWYWFLGQYDEPEGVLGEVAQTMDSLLSLASLGRGSRLTRAPYNTTTGVVPGAPEDLAAQAGLDVEAYSLARAIASEEGHSDFLIKVAVAWAIKNYADKHGRTITSLVTRANNGAHAGRYGTQRDIDQASANYNKSDRYCSTATDPYEEEGRIAQGVLEGSIADTTNGADQFDRPAGESDPDRIAQNRINAGAELVDVDGIDTSKIRFWRTA